MKFDTKLRLDEKTIMSPNLTEKFSEDEVEAVLAHELGHAKLKHIPKHAAKNPQRKSAAFPVSPK